MRPAWYALALKPCWLRMEANYSVVLLCVAKIKIEFNFWKNGDRRSVSSAGCLLLSRVMESWRFMRDRSHWVTMWPGYFMSKIEQIYS